MTTIPVTHVIQFVWSEAIDYHKNKTLIFSSCSYLVYVTSVKTFRVFLPHSPFSLTLWWEFCVISSTSAFWSIWWTQKKSFGNGDKVRLDSLVILMTFYIICLEQNKIIEIIILRRIELFLSRGWHLSYINNYFVICL